MSIVLKYLFWRDRETGEVKSKSRGVGTKAKINESEAHRVDACLVYNSADLIV